MDYDREKLSKLRVIDLKELLRSKSHKVSGNKNELIERILQNLPPSNTASQNINIEDDMEIKLDSLPKEMLIIIALELNLPDLFHFCLSSKKFNNAACSNSDFWRQKLLREKLLKKGHKIEQLSNTKDYYKIQSEKFREYLSKKLVEFSYNGNVANVKRALEKGADINYTHVIGSKVLTSIEAASEQGHLDVVKILIESGKKFQEYFLNNALIGALLNNHNNVAKYLIENGAYVSYDDNWALDLIRDTNNYEMMDFLKQRYGLDIY